MAKRQETPDILGAVLNYKPAAPPPEPEQIPLDRIRVDGGTQMRAQLDDPTVFEYTQAMVEANGWGTFPAVVCYYDGNVYWLGDGFHRVQAYRDAFPASNDGIPVEVRSGTRRDAILHAAGANALHGLRRTQADKRRAVETLLRDEEWAAWSDNEIARRCNVSPTTVGTLRKSLSLSNLDSEKPAAAPTERTYTTKHGTTATMQTSGIGRPDVPKVEAWRLEQVISGIPNLKASTLRTAARERKGHWLFDTAVSRAEVAHPGAWNQTRLIQAMHNVASQMEQRERQATPPQPPVSPEQRQYESAVAAIAVPQPPAGAAAYANKAADAGQDMPFTDPLLVPADLLQRGWVLKRVAGNGRWYCHNPNGPRATGVFDRQQDAIAAAREMQVDLLSEPQPVAAQQGPDDDETIAKMWNLRTAQGVFENMANYWQAATKIDILLKRDPDSRTGMIVSLGLLLHGTSWRTFEAPTLEEAVQKADRSL